MFLRKLPPLRQQQQTALRKMSASDAMKDQRLRQRLAKMQSDEMSKPSSKELVEDEAGVVMASVKPT